MVELSDQEVDKITDLSVKAAQKAAKKFGLEIGDTVSHPSDRLVYRLVDIVGDQMLVEASVDPHDQNGPKTTKTLPLDGAFDPNLAKEAGEYGGGLLKSKKIAKNN